MNRSPSSIPEAPRGATEQAARELAAAAPIPAVHRNVRMGTAGWTDPTLIKHSDFYPRGVSSARSRLEHYATQFSFVEVDATYYALISEETSRRWADWTPPSFRFHVKAHPVVTGHPIDVMRLPSDLRAAFEAAGFAGRAYAEQLPKELTLELEQRFASSLTPLASNGKLTAVLAQFPPWFDASRGNARRIEALRERFPELPFSVEFRHKSWVEAERRGRVFDLLRSLGFAYVVVDEPPSNVGGVPRVAEVTSDRLAVVRFHGRNLGGWDKKGASVNERFDYVYAPVELSEWTASIARLAARAEEVHVVFNNCVRDYAVVGAKGLAAVLARTFDVSEHSG
jgi:uncharacterized protein YecE (DUF72 family)